MLKFLMKPMKLEKSVVIRILSTTRVVNHRPFIDHLLATYVATQIVITTQS